MKKILLINGPNLNNLGNRESKFYGNVTLQEIENEVIKIGKNHSLEIRKSLNHDFSYLQMEHLHHIHRKYLEGR